MKLISLDPTLAHRSEGDSGVSKRARHLAERTLAELTPGDIAFCLRQDIAVSHVAPMAIDLVSAQALVEAEFYPGDLLLSLLEAARRNLLSAPQKAALRDVCAAAIGGADTTGDAVVLTAKSFIATYDGA